MRGTSLRLGSSIGVLASLIASAVLMPAMTSAQTTGGAPTNAPAAKDEKRPDPVVVTGTRSDVTSRADRVSFDVSKNLQAQAGTLADALRGVPGVEVDLEGNVSLRGDSGVKILVDGRESALFSGQGRATAINTMPAGQIERVEVITNPSAAMSPEGSGGIINLIMKQARPDTRYATIRGNVGGADRYAMSLNAVSSGQKLTLTGDLNYRRFSGDAELEQDRTRINPAETSRRETDLEMNQRGGNARAAADYDLDKANRLSSELNLFDFRNNIESDETFTSSIAPSSYARDGEIGIRSKGMGGKASWKRTSAPERELIAELSIFDGRFRRVVAAEVVPATAPVFFEEFRNGGTFNQKSAKTEYKSPTGKGSSIHVGYNGNFNRNEFDFFGARGPSEGALTPIAAFTNQFNLDETIHAVFGTYNFRLGKLEAMAGLRLEQVELDIDQVTDGQQFENDYFRAYPTMHLGFDLTKTQKLRASYSRRIQRPGAQDLNPYIIYLDPVNQRRGNPFLKPQVTDSFELSWQMRKGSTYYSLTGFYRDAKDGVTDIFTDLGNGIILTTRDNLGVSRSVGVEAIANGKLSKTITYNASATYQWLEIDPRVGGITQKSSGTTGTVRGNVNWQPTANDFFQLNGNYSGRQLLPQGYRKPSGMLNLGYRRKVNEKLSLLVTGQNILDTARSTTFFRTPTVTDRSEQRGMGRIVFFGATYTLGNTGGRPRRDPGFDFQSPGGDVPQ